MRRSDLRFAWREADASIPADALPSLDHRGLLAIGSPIRFYDTASGNLRWSYPDNWSGVHGSHNAPPPADGLLRGAFGIVGTAHLPEPVGDIWAINSNETEWHLLNRDGFYLSRVFQPEQMKVHYPEEAKPGADMTNATAGLGAEDFGGSLVQGTDGKVYVQAGKTGLWNLEVTGLETITKFAGGTLTITPEDARKATDAARCPAPASGCSAPSGIKKMSPSFTGKFDADFKGAEIVSYKKSDETAVRSALAWDDRNLYVAWEIHDPTPWVNNADRAEYLYKHGDTVDLQIGTDAKADPKRNEAVLGDLRLSIGPVAGKPTTIVYRQVATGADKHPFTFSSGVVHEYVMEDVRILPDVRIEVKVDAAGKKYAVEAAIPLVAIGLKPAAGLEILGDIGVTHGNSAGTDTRLRTYWSNQATGLVDDAVFELKMEPKNWGNLKFVP